MAQRIILDVDTGIDDALAILLAVRSPELEVAGITTVRGNHPVHICTENTLRVLDAIGCSVPVFEGMSQPLVRSDFHRRSSPTHGDYLDLPPARTAKQPAHAVDWLIETLLASDGEITLVPVGPLTNIAVAIRKAPAILPKIRELVIMGGGHAICNMTPSAEFNFWVDPHAARLVVNCGRPIRLVTLDATWQARVSRPDVAVLSGLGTAAGAIAAQLAATYIRAYEQYETGDLIGTAPVHDALAVSAVIDPAVISTRHVHVDVETQGELTSGRTVCDLLCAGSGQPNVHVALAADGARMRQMLVNAFARASEGAGL